MSGVHVRLGHSADVIGLHLAAAVIAALAHGLAQLRLGHHRSVVVHGDASRGGIGMGVMYAGQCADSLLHAEVIERLEQALHLDVHALHFALHVQFPQRRARPL